MLEGIHLGVILLGNRLIGKLTIHPQLLLGQPFTDPDEAPDDTENDNDAHSNTETVSGNDAVPTNLVMVEETVYVEALVSEGDEGQAEVASEQENQPENMHRWWRFRPREDYLKERKEAVEGMLANVGPRRELIGKPRILVQYRPVYDGDEERVRDYRRIE